MPGRHSILIVEDDPAIRDVYHDFLSSEGYEVNTAANGRAALRVMSAGPPPPDLILMDLLMPVLDGWELAAELATTPRLAHIPFVVVAAQAAPFGRSPPRGARAQLIKPVALDTLLATVRSQLAGPDAPDAGTARD